MLRGGSQLQTLDTKNLNPFTDWNFERAQTAEAPPGIQTAGFRPHSGEAAQVSVVRQSRGVEVNFTVILYSGQILMF